MRGGEKVLRSLARLYPDAPIFTLLRVPGSLTPDLEARSIHTTFVQHLPRAAKRYRSYLPVFPTAVATMNVHDYDLVVSSSHCVVKSVKVAPKAVHICYCHTPMRYVWDRFDDYFGPGRVSPLTRALARPVAGALRRWDAATASRVHHFVANSAYVAGRIARYYGRTAEVIPPPVDASFFTPGVGGPGDYDLVVTALAPYKRIELILEAYRGTGRRLRIVGRGPEEARLRRMAPREAEFLGYVDDESLRDLYRGSRAVIMASVEDFGIVPLEAMACGRAAVVFGEGGGPESVVEGETGLVFREPTAASLRKTVESLDRLEFDPATLRARAEQFDVPVFESRFRAFAESKC